VTAPSSLPIPFPITYLDKYRRGRPLDPDYPTNVRTFYSPIDDVHAVLKDLVGSARSSLVIAMYGYDDDELAALVDNALTNPNMYVQITLDSSQAGGVHEKALLQKYSHEMTGNSVAIGRSERGAIMHRKMCLVDGLWRITGSTNWSLSGEQKQDNELTVVQSASAVAEARVVLDIEHDAALQQMAAKAAAS
jgi:phosphatidylserine/phosphatidylglycerophosphate/cardiolipin synthase-like enzyme